MPPSLLDKHRAEEAQPVCGVQRVLLVLFTLAAVLLFFVNMASSTVAPARVRVSGADLAAQVLRRRAASQHHEDAGHASAMSLPPPSQTLVQVTSPPPPSPMAPAGVSDRTCHARLNTDYMGEAAPVWGLGNPGFHLSSPAECCAACQAHNQACGKPDSRHKSWWPLRPELRCGSNPGCNLWVYCPEEQCFAFDIHVHKRGECWLKYQRVLTRDNVTAPKDPHEGRTHFPEAMRKSPRKLWPWAVDENIWPGGIPERVPWISGVLAPPQAVVQSASADDPWRRRWCEKHGQAFGGCDRGL